MEGDDRRSGGPIYLSLEVFGDRWGLPILCDMMFGGRHFRELLRSEEGISSNILADRVRKLLGEGTITRADHPSRKQKAIYSLTEKFIALVPVFAHLGAWGRRHLPASEESSVRARVLEEGWPGMRERFMAEKREGHLGLPPGGRFEAGDGVTPTTGFPNPTPAPCRPQTVPPEGSPSPLLWPPSSRNRGSLCGPC